MSNIIGVRREADKKTDHKKSEHLFTIEYTHVVLEAIGDDLVKTLTRRNFTPGAEVAPRARFVNQSQADGDTRHQTARARNDSSPSIFPSMADHETIPMACNRAHGLPHRWRHPTHGPATTWNRASDYRPYSKDFA
ncbi:MAG: hypothetical protein ACI8WM_000373 [Burkholderiaceae bacterium]|jgi:hypothetical protein